MIEIPDEHLMRVTQEATGWKNCNRRMNPPRTWHGELTESSQALIEIRALLNSVPGLKCSWYDYPEPLYAFVPTLEVVNFLIKDRRNAWEWARKFKERLDCLKEQGVKIPDNIPEDEGAKQARKEFEDELERQEAERQQAKQTEEGGT